MSSKNEVGRELKADELKPKTVYVLMKPGRPAATMWFMELDPLSAVFFAGVTDMTLILRRLADGGFADDSNTRVFVHEYLGDV